MTPRPRPRVGDDPLAEIERRVQARAKEAGLDPREPGDADELRAHLRSELRAWNDDHRRGQRPFPIVDVDGIEDRAWRNLVGYGPLEPLLRDPDVWEIMINAPDQIFTKRHTRPSGFHDEVFHDDEHVLRILTRILDDAGASHRSLDPTEGLQDAQLDDGSRVHIVHGDVARGGHVMVNIRKFTDVPFRRLDELVDRRMLSRDAALFLRACVGARLTVLVSGAPGAGKTTLLSCAAAELDPTLRVVIAEEVFECDVPLPNVAQMQTRPPRADRPAVDLRRLVSGFLRMAPDIAIVGEVRDREALPLLLTLSSGVKGFTTIHAGSARQALTRLRFVAQLADHDLPLTALNALVAEAIDVVVHCERVHGVPRVTQILAVEDLQGGADAVQFTATDVFESDGGDLRWTGNVPVRAERAIRRNGLDLAALLDPLRSGALGADAAIDLRPAAPGARR